jgi:hypothetical protein
MWSIQEKCNFHTHSDFDTHKCENDFHDCGYNTQKSDFYTQSVILHAECAFYTRDSKFCMYASEYDTHEYDLYTLECDSYMQSVISIRSMILIGVNVIPTRKSVI